MNLSGKNEKRSGSDQKNDFDGFTIEGFTEEEIREVYQIFLRLIKKYKENPNRETTEWLADQLAAELPDKGEKEISKMAEEIVETIKEYGNDLDDLNQKCRSGRTKEEWLKEKILDGAKGVSVNRLGDYLNEIDRNLTNANAQMARTVLRADGEVNQNVNLDGFIAEQYHVNNFNAKAIMEGAPFRARVCVPENGRHTENSVDVMIDNIATNEKGVARYQFKFGQDSQSNINMLKRGNYDNQRIVVPKGQVENVKEYAHNKSVTDYIGGTDKIKVKSDPITKEQIKELQAKAQENGELPSTDWNSYQPQEMAKNIAKQAGQVGIQAAFIGAGLNIAAKALNGETIEVDEIVETAVKTGVDTFVKASAGGALKVAAEKNMIALFPPGTPAGTLVKIACVGVENVKILWKVAKGDLEMSVALEHMGRTSVSMYAGLSTGGIGAGIGAAALSFIPIIGPVLGGIVGGMVGYSAGNKFGETVFEGAKKIVKKGTEIVGKAKETIKDLGLSIVQRMRNLIPS